MGLGQELIESQVCLSNLDREQRVGLAVSSSNVRGVQRSLTFTSVYCTSEPPQLSCCHYVPLALPCE